MTLDEMISQLPTKPDAGCCGVFADALLAEGELQGQVMATQLGGRRDDEAERVLEALVRLVLHDDPRSGDQRLHIGWRLGFIDALGFSGAPSFEPIAESWSRLTELLTTPADLVFAMPWDARLGGGERATLERLRAQRLLARLRTVQVAPWELHTNYDDLWALLARQALPSSVRNLIVDDVPRWRRDPHQLTWTELGHPWQAWHALRHLESLFLRGSYVSLGDIDLPALRHFKLETSTLSGVDELCAARWPRLQTLSLCFGDDAYNDSPCSFEEVSTLLLHVPPTVTHLGLRNLPFTDALIDVLAQSSVLPRLNTLDLSLGVLLEGAAPLRRHAEAFMHLAQLEVSDTGLADFDALKQLIPGLTRTHEWRTKTRRFVSLSD